MDICFFWEGGGVAIGQHESEVDGEKATSDYKVERYWV